MEKSMVSVLVVANTGGGSPLPYGAALCEAKVPGNISIMMVKKNILGTLILTPSLNTSTANLTPHLPIIHTAACKIHPSLMPPRLNEKWYKLAIHGIPMDYYPDSDTTYDRTDSAAAESTYSQTTRQR
jgi:hypothetical protein